MSAADFKKIAKNPTLKGLYKLVPNVVYSTATEKELTLDLILPWSVDDENIETAPQPLVVFVQGSAWTTPDRNFEMPQLSALALKGYTVATVGHRSAIEGARVPSFLQDVKCAIRFLRENAAKYAIDPERVMIFGTSSGGNTAELVGLTGDMPEFETAEHAGYSDAVKAVIACFGPADLRMTFHYDPDRKIEIDPNKPDDLMVGAFGPDPALWGGKLDSISPVQYVSADRTCPPFLLLHGSGDPVVSFEESVKLHDMLKDAGKDVEAWEIEGANHEADFWSAELWEIITDYIRARL